MKLNLFGKMNLIDLLFIQFTIVIVVLGSLMNLVEKYLPSYVKQMFRYGKHSYKGDDKKGGLINSIEIPKSWFKHFYVFAIVWSWLGFLLAVAVYFYDYQPQALLLKYLDLSCGNDRKIETSPLKTLTALLLMTIQCTRRFVETNFLQIFSKKSKINLTHYMCGYLHYYGVIVLIVAKGDGFQTNQMDKSFIKYELLELVQVVLVSCSFIYFCYKQFETNMIFINLRKSKSGNVATEKHLLPQGGLFKYVSSPHMLCEIAMYLILFVLLYQNTSYKYCLFWVLSNQISNALLTHKWYLETFKDYSKLARKAIIPFIL